MQIADNVRSGGRASRPELAARPSDTLPRLLTSFVGRREVVDSLVQEILRPDHRLITVVGTGGIGKTRLAIAASQQVEPEFPDGVWFVPLASVTESRQIPSAIVQTLGIRESGVRPVDIDLSLFLSSRRCLLVIDNFEHLLEGASWVADLVNTTENPTFLVTSRSVLRVRAEHSFPVPALGSGERSESPEDDPGEAVQLFLERARLVKADFRLTPENRRTVEEICRHLDGLPLAIELAAARMRFLTPTGLLERLKSETGDSFQLLSGGPRDAPDRQRSLQETIRWSYELLDERERIVFRRLCVFPGGFDLDSASAICDSAVSNPSAGSLEIYDTIASLLDKSLILQRQLAGGETRFHMLATVREFAREALSAAGEERLARERHAAYFLRLAESSAEALEGTNQRSAKSRLSAEHANLDAALKWYEEKRDIDRLYRLAWALFFYWWHRGLTSESRNWYERLIVMQEGVLHPKRAWIEYAATIGANIAGDFERSAKLVGMASETARRNGTPIVEGMMHAMDAYIRLAAEDRDGAVQSGVEAVEIFRRHADGFWLATGLAEAGLFIAAAGEPDVGIPLIEEALQLDLGRGDAHMAGVRMSDLGVMSHDRGDESSAIARYSESIGLLVEADATWYLASPVLGIAAVVGADDPHNAALLIGAAKELRGRGGTVGWATEMERDQRASDLLVALIGQEAYDDAIEAGARLSISDVVDVATDAAARWQGPSDSTGHELSVMLSEREREVLRLIVTGLSDREIGDTLFISPRTASKHVGNILNKLGVDSRSEAAVFALRYGIQ